MNLRSYSVRPTAALAWVWLWLLLAAGGRVCGEAIYTPFTFVTATTGGAPGASPFQEPNGVALDGAGNLYVADTYNQVVRKFRPGQAVQTLAGGFGIRGYEDRAGGDARFSYPWGVAVDAAGNVFVADNFNYVIRKITPAGRVSTFAGHPQILNGPLGDIVTGGFANAPGTNALFGRPVGVVLDAAGNLYVADTGCNAIRKITPDARVSSLAGVTELKTNFLGTFQPIGGSVDGPGNVARFNEPTGIAIDDAGNLYVGDVDNHTIRKVTPAGFVTTLAGTPGRSGYLDGPAARARFSYPAGVAVDAAGNVYVGDTGNNVIRRITPAGVVTTLAGLFGHNTARDGTGREAGFAFPQDLKVDAQGTLYVVDTRDNSIRIGQPALFLQPTRLSERQLRLQIQTPDAGLTNQLASLELQSRATLPSGTDINWPPVPAVFFVTNGLATVDVPVTPTPASRLFRVQRR